MDETKNNYKHPEYLIETDWLEQHLDDDNLRIIDCSVFVEPNPDTILSEKLPFVFKSGLDNFNKGHIPHSGYINITTELSDDSSKIPLMMPTKEQFVNVMSNFGITDSSYVVLYSSTEQNWATRLWWMLRSFSFNNVAVLNGGWAKWHAEKKSVSDKACTYKPGKFTAKSVPDFFVMKDEVQNTIGDDNVRLINALPNGFFTGESDIVFGRKGRIPDSVNIPFVSLHDSDTGSYLSATELQKLFDTVNINNADQIITYCGGGMAATNTAFALALLGYNNVAVYDGSMLEWGNDYSLSMEQG